MKINVQRFNEFKGIVNIGFDNMGHIQYHEIILKILTDELKCETLSYDDKITDIDSHLRWKGIEFEFNHHYMLGNIICTVPEYADTFEQLANKVAEIINEKIKQNQENKSN